MTIHRDSFQLIRLGGERADFCLRLNCTTLQLDVTQDWFDGEYSSILALFNHLIRPLKHAGWNCQTDLFCRFKVDDEFKLRRLLHRQISRFGTFQDLVHVNSRAPK